MQHTLLLMSRFVNRAARVPPGEEIATAQCRTSAIELKLTLEET